MPVGNVYHIMSEIPYWISLKNCLKKTFNLFCLLLCVHKQNEVIYESFTIAYNVYLRHRFGILLIIIIINLYCDTSNLSCHLRPVMSSGRSLASLELVGFHQCSISLCLQLHQLISGLLWRHSLTFEVSQNHLAVRCFSSDSGPVNSSYSE